MENNNEQNQEYSPYEATEEINIGYAILSFIIPIVDVRIKVVPLKS